jgi:hypothetical protein
LSASREVYWEAKVSKEDMTARKSLKEKQIFDEGLLIKVNSGKLACDREKPTGFPEEGVAAAAVEGVSFPLEREEAVDIWAARTAAGAEASEAAGFGRTTPDLAFLGGGSMKPSSL